MKPNFALSLSHDGISLLHRTPHGWRMLGEVALDDPAMTEKLIGLRTTAHRLEPQGMATKLILPNSVVLYKAIHAPGPDADSRQAQIRAALDKATPYTVDALTFDWSGDGDTVQVAVIANETLQEAETFAQQYHLSPLCFVAIPEPGVFEGEAFFGPTRRAVETLGPQETVERDRAPLQVINAAPPPEPAVSQAQAPRAKARPAPAKPAVFPRVFNAISRGISNLRGSTLAQKPRPRAVLLGAGALLCLGLVMLWSGPARETDPLPREIAMEASVTPGDDAPPAPQEVETPPEVADLDLSPASAPDAPQPAGTTIPDTGPEKLPTAPLASPAPPPAPIRSNDLGTTEQTQAQAEGPDTSAPPTSSLAPPRPAQEASAPAGDAPPILEPVRARARAATIVALAQAQAEADAPPALEPTLRPSARPQNFSKAIEEALTVAAVSTPAEVKQPAAAPPPAAAAPKATPTPDEEEDEPEPQRAAPNIPTSASVAQQATLAKAISLRQVNLIGVYGTTTNRYALVRLGNGKMQKVKTGDKLDGGQVAAIGGNELRYVKSGKNIVLKMPGS